MMRERWTASLKHVAREPMTEGLLDRAHEGPRMAPPGPTSARRGVTAAIALALGAAAVVMAVRAFGDGGSAPAQQSREPIDGWTATVPAGWDAAPIHSSDGASGHGSPLLGWAVASHELDQSVSSLFDMFSPGAVPLDGVFVRLIRIPPSAAPLPEEGAQFPIELAAVNENGVSRTVSTNATHLNIDVVFGPDSTEQLRAQAVELVESIRFPELPEPPVGVAVPLSPGVVVLGSADRFPLGSVTPMEVEDPTSDLHGWRLFLVHAPRGFYVIYGPERNADTCPLRWLEAKRLFVRCDGKTWGADAHRVDGKGVVLPALPVSLNFDDRLMTSRYGGQRMADPASYWNVN
jgi:hypothetical protein